VSKLSEILAAKRAAEALAKQPKPPEVQNVIQRIENPPIVAQETGEKLPTIRQEGGGNPASGGQTAGTTVATNGPVGEQENAPVLLTGLKAKLAERLKQNATAGKPDQVREIVQRVEPNAPQNIPLAEDKAVSQPAAQVLAVSQDRHSSVGSSTGVIDGSELRKNLDFLAANIEQQELVRQIVATIAIQLRQNPALKEYMKDADVDLVVRGLRRSYNVAKRAKTEKAELKTKKKQVDLDLDKALSEMGLDLKL
jgi:hypothetical protein